MTEKKYINEFNKLLKNKYTIFKDSYNYWLRVPKTTITFLRIQKHISKSSRMSDKYVFLTENDTELFINTLLSDYNTDYKVAWLNGLTENHYETCHVRAYDNYNINFL